MQHTYCATAINALRLSDAYCVSKLIIIGSDNGLLPGRCQAIFWTNAGILLIRTLGTNFKEILNEIHTFSFKKMHLKMLSTKWLPSCLSLNVLNIICLSKVGRSATHCFHCNGLVGLITAITSYVVVGMSPSDDSSWRLLAMPWWWQRWGWGCGGCCGGWMHISQTVHQLIN